MHLKNLEISEKKNNNNFKENNLMFLLYKHKAKQGRVSPV